MREDEESEEDVEDGCVANPAADGGGYGGAAGHGGGLLIAALESHSLTGCFPLSRRLLQLQG